MIYFKKISWKNLLSTGNNPIEINLLKDKRTLIVGANGCGKSTLLEALSFVLFGRPFRNINKPQLVNSINRKECLVICEFSIGSRDYKLIRGLSPRVFEIWCDGVLLNQDSHSRDYQKFLETNILKMSYQAFYQIVVLGAGNFIPFMQLTAWQRREFVEDLLDISIFSKIRNILKEKIQKEKELFATVDKQIFESEIKIESKKKYIHHLREINKKSANELKEEINNLKNDISNRLTDVEKAEIELAPQREKYYGYLKTYQERKNKFNEFEAQIKLNIRKNKKNIDFYEKNGECPTCLQKINEKTKHDHLKQYYDNDKEYKEGLIQLNEKIKNLEEKIIKYRSVLDRVIKKESQIAAEKTNIKSSQARLNILETKLVELNTIQDIECEENQLIQLNEEYRVHTQNKLQLLDESRYNELIYDMMKDAGIKTRVIRRYLPLMTKYINSYLEVLDFFVLFSIDENFNETIHAHHRDAFSYSSFSEGEKMRLDLAIMFAWRQIAKIKNSVSTNLLILDETFDSSLDIDGIDNLLKILTTLEESTHVFVISHKQDLLEGKFDKKIEFAKVNNFSYTRSS
jgi:DNA repair exonuclease SbcCD ATPase subunit